MGRKPNRLVAIPTEVNPDESEESLLGQLRAINSAQEGRGFDPEISMACAAVSRALTSVRSEQRQHAKAERRAIKDIPLDQIVAHLRSLPESKRRAVCSDILGLDDAEPLL